MSHNLDGWTILAFCLLMTLPGVWLTIRRGPVRGIATSLAVALAAILTWLGISLAVNRLTYGYWTPDSPDYPGVTRYSLAMVPLFLTIVVWGPLQLIGIGVGWAIRWRQRRRGG